MLSRLWAGLFLSALTMLAAGELSGRRAPGFALPDLNLNYHDLADLQGRVVLLEIMQTTCPHCKTLSANIEKAKRKFGNRIAVLYLVNPPDNQGTVQNYIAQNGITSPVVFDCGQVTASYLMITPQRPTVSVPHLFLIDRNGYIRSDFAHSEATKSILEGNGLDVEITKLLNAAPLAPKSSAPPKK
ncbi:MAG: TlpA family protein disulfide reductase [Acidobacteriota bacterium]|jgi:peroxiredoxin